jgi:NADH-quinone oxidoreductase subunit E
MGDSVGIEAGLNLGPLDEILASMPDVGAESLVPILQQVQKAYGHLPRPILMEVSERTGIPASRIFGVATFYEQFHLEPHGRHTIRCCRGTACHVKGGHNIVKAVKQALGVEPGQTTEDMRFTFETVACLGTCFLAPAMMINNDYYGHMNTRKIKSILERYS